MVERAKLRATLWSLGIRHSDTHDGVVLLRWSVPRVRLETLWKRGASAREIAEALRELASKVETA